MSLVDDIIGLLQTAGVGAFPTNLFDNHLPDPLSAPDPCMAVFEYAGQPPERAFSPTNTRPVLVYPRIQFQARSTNLVTARNKAVDAVSALGWVHNQDIGGVRYHAIMALTDPPVLLTRDANDRWVWMCNFEVKKAPST